MKVVSALSIIAFIALSSGVSPVRADTLENAGCRADKPLTPEASDKDRYEYVYAEAECLRLAAAQIGAEWLKTGELLKGSTEQAARQNWDEATGLVQKAQFQAITALQQADYESEAWKHRVLK